MNYEDIEKIRKRTSKLIQVVSPSVEEKKEMDDILNLESHPKINGLKTALLQAHYKSKLKDESENFHLHTNKFYFRILVFMRIDKLNETKHLSPSDANDLMELSRLEILARDKYLMLEKIVQKFQHNLKIEDQISLCEDWIKRPKYQLTALKIIFRNYKEIIPKSRFLKLQIRLLAGSQLYKREKTCKNVICYQLKANFRKVEKRDRNMLVELIVKTMTKDTERAARKLFSQRFNLLPVSIRNNILTNILNTKELPEYYIKSFLLDRYKDVSIINYELINATLRVNENGM